MYIIDKCTFYNVRLSKYTFMYAVRELILQKMEEEGEKEVLIENEVESSKPDEPMES